MNYKKVLVGLCILGAVIISGCTGNNSQVIPSETTAAPQETPPLTKNDVPEITQTPTPTLIKETISDNPTKNTNTSPLVSPNNSWCTPGDKKKLAAGEFTIVEIVTKNGIDLCKAELTIPGGKTTHYFSQDGNISITNSTSVSDNASASSNASASVSSTGTSTTSSTVSDNTINAEHSTTKVG